MMLWLKNDFEALLVVHKFPGRAFSLKEGDSFFFSRFLLVPVEECGFVDVEERQVNVLQHDTVEKPCSNLFVLFDVQFPTRLVRYLLVTFGCDGRAGFGFEDRWMHDCLKCPVL